MRLFAAAERTGAEIGVVRLPPEAEHWAAIEAGFARPSAMRPTPRRAPRAPS